MMESAFPGITAGIAGAFGAEILAQQKTDISTVIFWALVVVALLVGVAIIAFFLAFGKLWLQAYSSGCPVAVKEFIGMYLRKVNPKVIVDVLVMATKAGMPVGIEKLQAHVLARGNVRSVVTSLIAASKAEIPLSFEKGAAIDLAGRDVLDAVRTSVHPRVIDCPNPALGRPTVDAVAMNGIQLRCRARVTVRTNLLRLVGGATEETVIARVGQGIVAAIGKAESHKDVLADPQRISREVLSAGLDAGTAFEILSVDVADIDVGENIGAKLIADQAKAELVRAQAEAEAQRARAVARGQEMEALGKENRAKVILAEAEIPLAISEAFRSGNLGIMDYYSLRNLQADTQMREQLSRHGDGGGAEKGTKQSEG
jgi:uncharacterized protein YqfA (UPF0365 family)